MVQFTIIEQEKGRRRTSREEYEQGLWKKLEAYGNEFKEQQIFWFEC